MPRVTRPAPDTRLAQADKEYAEWQGRQKETKVPTEGRMGTTLNFIEAPTNLQKPMLGVVRETRHDRPGIDESICSLRQPKTGEDQGDATVAVLIIMMTWFTVKNRRAKCQE